MHLLEVPAVFSGSGLHGNHGNREQIVAEADTTVEIRPRIAGGEIDETEVGIDGRSLPNRGSAVFPRVVILRPAVVADLAGTGDGIKRPDQATLLGVVRFYASTGAVLATGKTHNDHAVVVERRSRNREPLLPALEIGRAHV